ncbi:MAG: class II aldolase/adducin family protein [Lachnospiraceae bacterium]|nr:class II aldolase/adducin family protein [Lachnospiraceae bacterium]
MAYEIKEGKELVIRAGLELLKTGLIARTWGNISARISDTQFVITPSGRAYDALTPDDIVVVNIADCSYEGSVKPSSEKGVHAAAYRNRPDVNFVIHTHQNYASAISALRVALASGVVDPDSMSILGRRVPAAEYGISSTKKLTKAVETAIVSNGDSRAVLMVNHGTLCMGKDYEDAFAIAHKLEDVAKLRFESLCGTLLPGEADAEHIGEHEEVIGKLEGRYGDIYTDETIGCAILSRAPFTLAISKTGKTMKPYIDDMAQIGGVDTKCLPENASMEQIRKALKGRHAVLIENVGALCVSPAEDDARAVCTVLEKNAMAALLKEAGDSPKAVDPISAFLEHTIYEKKYSKLKKQ